ncbi:hypothetical protein MUCCIDRAFT_156637 [Mucor lusitanicus CBS 277.49]|uniref:Uncharacterized protein n=1 Tax=Mucor lusitanicus CBS 277.49 TaxID=747725 RepID=A0A168J5A1_MUCCL|nr:hypothetical protein MUCCIDRAFT_156637 [Mucor lusitanicus CBS 277.49]
MPDVLSETSLKRCSEANLPILLQGFQHLLPPGFNAHLTAESTMSEDEVLRLFLSCQPIVSEAGSDNGFDFNSQAGSSSGSVCSDSIPSFTDGDSVLERAWFQQPCFF